MLLYTVLNQHAQYIFTSICTHTHRHICGGEENNDQSVGAESFVHKQKAVRWRKV